MFRIEYIIPTAEGKERTIVMFADDADEANEICEKCDEYGYRIVDVSRYVEEVE